MEHHSSWPPCPEHAGITHQPLWTIKVCLIPSLCKAWNNPILWFQICIFMKFRLGMLDSRGMKWKKFKALVKFPYTHNGLWFTNGRWLIKYILGLHHQADTTYGSMFSPFSFTNRVADHNGWWNTEIQVHGSSSKSYFAVWQIINLQTNIRLWATMPIISHHIPSKWQ